MKNKLDKQHLRSITNSTDSKKPKIGGAYIGNIGDLLASDTSVVSNRATITVGNENNVTECPLDQVVKLDELATKSMTACLSLPILAINKEVEDSGGFAEYLQNRNCSAQHQKNDDIKIAQLKNEVEKAFLKSARTDMDKYAARLPVYVGNEIDKYAQPTSTLSHVDRAIYKTSPGAPARSK